MGKQYEEFKEEARQVWEEQEKERIEAEKSQRENDVKNRDRMQRMIADKDVYLDGLLRERKNIFEKKLEEFNAMLSDERKQRLGKRIGLRKEDASGCKRREMKSRDVETKLLKEKEKRGRQEKLRRDKEELRKRKRDVLILKKLNRRKEKRKGRLRTDLQDKKRKKGKRCRTGGTKMVAIEVALGAEERQRRAEEEEKRRA